MADKSKTSGKKAPITQSNPSDKSRFGKNEGNDNKQQSNDDYIVNPI